MPDIDMQGTPRGGSQDVSRQAQDMASQALVEEGLKNSSALGPASQLAVDGVRSAVEGLNGGSEAGQTIFPLTDEQLREYLKLRQNDCLEKQKEVEHLLPKGKCSEDSIDFCQ